MNSEKMNKGSKDLISSLPDALICHILSFLSTKNVALTSVLSKRWRYLLAFVPILDFDNSIYDYPKMSKRKRQQMHRSFKVFVDRVMALQGNASVKKFSLRYETGLEPSFVNGWIFNVLERGVVDLDLSISSDYDYPLPSKLLMSKTLVRLKVKDIDDFTVEEVFLPKLKNLSLDDVGFEESGTAFSKLISACHVLEELVMVDVLWDFWESCSVSNPTLKRLTICCDCIQYYIDANPTSVSFDTPNLVYLQFIDTVAVKYPKVNFDSLVEASVDLRMTLDDNEPGGDSADATNFFVGICNVKILYLSAATLEVLTFCCKAIPVFKNRIHLTIETDRKVGWESLPSLLEKCPNLETLVFEGLNYKDTNQCWDEGYCFRDANVCWDNNVDRCVCKPWEGTPICLSSSPVKMLKILRFGEITNVNDMDKQIQVIKYFLETMPNLDEVILYYDTPFDDDVNIISTTLQMLEEVASPNCKIQVISDNISFFIYCAFFFIDKWTRLPKKHLSGLKIVPFHLREV